MEDNYAKAYKEVIEVLNYVPQESVNKIPQVIIDTFKANMDKNYVFKVDINKSFEEQNLLSETKAIFANIFRDYWATPYQKEKIIEKEKAEMQKLEEEKREKYNPDNIFKDRKRTEKTEIKQEENSLIEVKKEKFFEKILKFFKNLFKL